MEIKQKDESNQWSGSKYAIQEQTYNLESKLPQGEAIILEEVVFSNTQEFLELTIKLGKENKESLQRSEELCNPFYLVKTIINI